MTPKVLSLEGTTLALKHYYDIAEVSRRLPLMTVYRADEHPFGHPVAVWMAEYGAIVSEATEKRLDRALLLNRRVDAPSALRVLDFGTSDGRSFLVTEALSAVTLKSLLSANGPLAPWQALRLLDQLAAVVRSAHRTGFCGLCIDAKQIFVTDPDRMTVTLAPMGIGLTRSEVSALKGIAVTPDLVRHIPPREYADIAQNAAGGETPASAADMPPAPADAPQDANAENGETAADAAQDIADPETDGSVQDIAAAAVADGGSDPASFGADDDAYTIAAVIYESLCAAHPYFGEDADLATAALDLSQANPIELARRVDIDPALSDAVMRFLAAPKAESIGAFLDEFAAACSPQSRENARRAEKTWLEPKPERAPAKRQKKIKSQSNRSLHIALAVIAALFVLTVAATYRIARAYRPADLFAIPEIVPQAQDGVDLLFTSAAQGKQTLYLTSIADGSLMRLGDLPYIFRNRPKGAKLNFVVAGDDGKSTQIPVTVKSDGDFMIVRVPAD